MHHNAIMSFLFWPAIILAGYALLAVALDGPAHRLIYPLVGWGYPLEGRRRWLVCVFAPFVLLGIFLCRVPIMVLVLLAFALGPSK